MLRLRYAMDDRMGPRSGVLRRLKATAFAACFSPKPARSPPTQWCGKRRGVRGNDSCVALRAAQPEGKRIVHLDKTAIHGLRETDRNGSDRKKHPGRAAEPSSFWIDAVLHPNHGVAQHRHDLDRARFPCPVRGRRLHL